MKAGTDKKSGKLSQTDLNLITMKSILLFTLTVSLIALSNNGAAQSSDPIASGFELSDDLIDAVSDMDVVSLNVLLADGADINVADQKGNTPLMVASKNGNPRIVGIILAHNPDVDVKNADGKTALMIAAEHGQTLVVEQLIEEGANFEAKNAEGFTPLEIARRNGHAEIVQILQNKTEKRLTHS